MRSSLTSHTLLFTCLLAPILAAPYDRNTTTTDSLSKRGYCSEHREAPAGHFNLSIEPGTTMVTWGSWTADPISGLRDFSPTIVPFYTSCGTTKNDDLPITQLKFKIEDWEKPYAWLICTIMGVPNTPEDHTYLLAVGGHVESFWQGSNFDAGINVWCDRQPSGW